MNISFQLIQKKLTDVLASIIKNISKDKNIDYFVCDTFSGVVGSSEVDTFFKNSEYIYFGTTDYTAPDTVFITNHAGELINQIVVGAIPRDFISISE